MDGTAEVPVYGNLRQLAGKLGVGNEMACDVSIQEPAPTEALVTAYNARTGRQLVFDPMGSLGPHSNPLA